MGDDHLGEVVVGRGIDGEGGQDFVEGVVWRLDDGAVGLTGVALVDSERLKLLVVDDERFAVELIERHVGVQLHLLAVAIGHAAVGVPGVLLDEFIKDGLGLCLEGEGGQEAEQECGVFLHVDIHLFVPVRCLFLLQYEPFVGQVFMGLDGLAEAGPVGGVIDALAEGELVADVDLVAALRERADEVGCVALQALVDGRLAEGVARGDGHCFLQLDEA